MSTEPRGMGFTRARDLAAVALIAVIAGFLIVRFNYSRIPPLPRLAGLAAAVLGIAEATAGLGLRSRINAPPDPDGRPSRPPVPPLVAARAVMAAKATALAGAAFGGLWLGLLLYVLPKSTEVEAARQDVPSAVVGVIGALIMTAGALFLESCCRTPTGSDPGGPAGRRR